jgi:peroxiredoxin
LEALWQKYKSRNVQVLIIDVKESKEIAAKWAVARKLTFPVLLDADGKVSASYAPADVLPDLARDEICIASNLIIDPKGRIQFFSLLDSKSFDAKLIALTTRLEELIAKAKS